MAVEVEGAFPEPAVAPLDTTRYGPAQMGAFPPRSWRRLLLLLGVPLASGGTAHAEPKPDPPVSEERVEYTADGCVRDDAVEVVPIGEIAGVKLPAGTRGATAPWSGKVSYVLCTPGETPASIERKLRAALAAAGFVETRSEDPGVVQSVWHRGTFPLYFTCPGGPNWELTTCPRCDADARNPRP